MKVLREPRHAGRARVENALARSRSWLGSIRQRGSPGADGGSEVASARAVSLMSSARRRTPDPEDPMPLRRRPLLLLAGTCALVVLGVAACSKNQITAPGLDSVILVQTAGPVGTAPAAIGSF